MERSASKITFSGQEREADEAKVLYFHVFPIFVFCIPRSSERPLTSEERKTLKEVVGVAYLPTRKEYMVSSS